MSTQNHIEIDVPLAAQHPSESSTAESELRELLAPFVAWLATQGLDESTRSRHRDAAERFLRWSRGDTGPLEGRRIRYDRYLHRYDPDHRADARAGLLWWTDHRMILSCTLPIDR